MTSEIKSTLQINLPILRKIAFWGIGFFLITMLLTAFVIIPKINQSLESQHSTDLNAELKLEAILFKRFIESQRIILQDLAKFPSFTTAAMLSDGDSRAISELVDNIVINGEKSSLVLQNIAGDILLQTSNDLQGQYSNNSTWLEPLLSGEQLYDFQLLEQQGDRFKYKMSVPVLYNSYIEGVLSAEIDVSLQQVFIVMTINDHVAFSLTQNDVTISTGVEHIKRAEKITLTLEPANILFTYITDQAPLIDSKASLKNTILSVLFFSLTLSFLLFTLLGYRGLVQGDQVAQINPAIWRAYMLPILVGLIGVAATIAAYLMILNYQQGAYQKNLIVESQQKIQDFREALYSKMQVLEIIKSFYSASNKVDRQEFKAFVSPLLTGHADILSLQWVPYILHAQRSNYERQVNLQEYDDFMIADRDVRGKLIAAAPRFHYFPISYVESVAENNQLIGFDLGTDFENLATFVKAKNTSEIAISAPKIKMHNDQKQTINFLVNPVFNQRPLNMPSVDEAKPLLGYVLLVLDTENMLNDIANKGTKLLSLIIKDVSHDYKSHMIYGPEQQAKGFSRSETIHVGGRDWLITTYTADMAAPTNWLSWLILLVGLVFSGLVTISLIHLIRRREIVEQQVSKRTQELAESEAQHRAVVDNAVDGLITISDRGIIERFNHSAEHIFGYSAAEVLGQNIKMLMPEPYHSEHDSYLDNYRTTGRKKIIGIGRHVQGRRKDGSTFSVDLSISEINLGKTQKFSGIVRDITERVALEVEREKFIENLTDSNEELERFAFVCSHDLQEPLRMIRSFSDKLQLHIADSLEHDEKGKKYFHFIIDGATRAQALITDILTYSSIGSDTQKLEEFDVEELINVIRSNLLDSVQKTGKISHDPLPNLRGNKTQLLQLFQNLINNGIKYQKADTLPEVHISTEEIGEYWKFAITDNGIGIEERHLSKVFEVFQRLHRKSQYAGTGIGLSICKKVVERHGGKIWVTSEKGIGSTFYFTLLKSELKE